MALTVKHLNGDASFMLTFEALLPDQPPFRILIDPWITGKSKIFHSKISVTTHKERACITSLRELPEPDLVIISQNKSDHCNEDSLRQLPARNTKTIILAEPASARTIRSWKYFEKGKVQAIPRWGDPRLTGRQAVVRVRVPSACPGQVEPGELTVAFIPQRKDITGLHAAIGITYRPPQAMMPPPRRCYNSLAPSPTPRSHKSYTHLRPPPAVCPPNQACPATNNNACTPTPASPTSSTTLRSVRSASSLATTMRDSCYSTASFSSLDRPLSVIFSPHGINYASLHSYTTSHLVAEAALPLTALLHCFDSVSNPWWLGGNILLGAPAGMEIASRLGARAWISTHDGEKVVKGIATGFLRTRKWREEDVLGAMSSAELSWRRDNKRMNDRKLEDLSSSTLALPSSPTTTLSSTVTTEKIRIGTDVVRLRSGEEVLLTNVPTLMLDHDGPIPHAQETPAAVNIVIPQPTPSQQHDTEIPSSPAFPPPPPRSALRPVTPRPLSTKKSSSEISITSARVPDIPVRDTTPSNENHLEATTQTDTQEQHDPQSNEIHIAVPQNPTPPPPQRQPPPPPPSMAPPPPLITTAAPTMAVAIPPTPKNITFPDIPPSFTERRWNRTRSGIRGRGNNKTQSESDFASFEEIMMMMRDS